MIVLIDTSFLAYQASWALKSLQNDDTCTGVVFGVLSRVLSIGTRFRTNNFHFCFDSPSSTSVRRQALPSYKNNRAAETEEAKEEKRLLYSQIALLQRTVHEIGWPCYCSEGFETDDIIASLVQQHAAQNEICIVSADGDLHQLLGSSSVFMFNPTKHEIIREKHLPYLASEVPMMKAIAGCTSDNVKGVRGAGEVRALRWIRGDVPSVLPKWARDIELSSALIEANMSLVKLPHKQMPPACLLQPALSIEAFNSACALCGFESFVRPPMREKWSDLLSGQYGALVNKSAAPLGRISQKRRKHGPDCEIEGFGL